MKRNFTQVSVSLSFLYSLRGINPMTSHAVPTIQIDNDHTRVTEFRFAPGATTGFHRHEYDYVVVPLTSGTLEITGPDGSVSQSELKSGISYSRPVGVEHDVKNANNYEFVFIEVEYKKT